MGEVAVTAEIRGCAKSCDGAECFVDVQTVQMNVDKGIESLIVLIFPASVALQRRISYELEYSLPRPHVEKYLIINPRSLPEMVSILLFLACSSS
jgi:hypothetical protein